VYNTLLVLIILCIFVFSCLLFRIYIIGKNKKKRNRKQSLLPVEPAVGSMKPPFQLTIAASQTAATIPALPPLLQSYCQFKRRQALTAV
jgi:hypothetical protein